LHTPIKLIVGLGNPDPEYQETRHNAGAWFVSALADKESAILRAEQKFKGLTCKIHVKNQDCWLLIPTTYMNLSGQAVKAIANFYKISLEEILVVHDDLDFPAGTIRLKQGGGHGGHNGLRDIIRHMHSNHFYRMRIGIGHPGNRDDVVDYVLKRPSRKDYDAITDEIEHFIPWAHDIISGDIHKVMNTLHTDASK